MASATFLVNTPWTCPIGVTSVQVALWRCDQGEWRQRNRRTGHVATIYPETQASNTMHRIRSEVLEKVPESSKTLFCFAVWFPDGAVDRAKLPMNLHPQITLDHADIAQPAAAIQRAFDYWHSKFPG